jgi:hypothetical protein
VSGYSVAPPSSLRPAVAFAPQLLFPIHHAILTPPPSRGPWSACIRAVPSAAFSSTASNVHHARLYCPLGGSAPNCRAAAPPATACFNTCSCPRALPTLAPAARVPRPLARFCALRARSHAPAPACTRASSACLRSLLGPPARACAWPLPLAHRPSRSRLPLLGPLLAARAPAPTAARVRSPARQDLAAPHAPARPNRRSRAAPAPSRRAPAAPPAAHRRLPLGPRPPAARP